MSLCCREKAPACAARAGSGKEAPVATRRQLPPHPPPCLPCARRTSRLPKHSAGVGGFAPVLNRPPLKLAILKTSFWRPTCAFYSPFPSWLRSPAGFISPALPGHDSLALNHISREIIELGKLCHRAARTSAATTALLRQVSNTQRFCSAISKYLGKVYTFSVNIFRLQRIALPHTLCYQVNKCLWLKAQL